MKNLHPTQRKLLVLLKQHAENPLTMRELQEELGVSSTSMVHHHISQLEKRGYLRRNPTNSHDYQVLADEPNKKIAYLNLYGLARCGPQGTILDGNPIERIPVATALLGFDASQAFMVRAKGDSMEPKIKNGDFVIVKKVESNQAPEGSIVVCTNNGETMIKQFRSDIGSKKIILVSLNSHKYPPIVANGDDFRIEGVVRLILSHN